MFLPLQQTFFQVADSIPSAHQELKSLKSLSLDEFINTAIDSLIRFAIHLVIAIIVFYAGKFIVKKIYKLLRTFMIRREVDLSLMTFILSMVKIVLYFILVVIVIGILGIETTSFIALFGAAGVAVGMALSGTLQNFAGGVLILLLKPYKIGDYIETQGYAGYVREIQIFHTIICTYDNKTIILPNGGLSTGSINNWSRQDYRRVDWTVSISYGDDVDLARQAILDIFKSDDRIVVKYLEDDRQMRQLRNEVSKDCLEQGHSMEECLEMNNKVTKEKTPWYKTLFHKKNNIGENTKNKKVELSSPIISEKVDCQPSVNVDVLNSSSVDLKARAWTRTEYYWPVFYEINERIYKELPKAGIRFPFPQMDVHLDKIG